MIITSPGKIGTKARFRCALPGWPRSEVVGNSFRNIHCFQDGVAHSGAFLFFDVRRNKLLLVAAASGISAKGKKCSNIQSILVVRVASPASQVELGQQTFS